LSKELKERIRAVTKGDEKLPRFSYSKIDTFKKCPTRYRLQYLDGKRSEDTTIALEIGSLLHKVLECKAEMMIRQEVIDYEFLNRVLTEGAKDGNETILGTKQLRRKYFDKYSTPDDASGMSYVEKIELFKEKVLPVEMENGDWIPMSTEMPFEFIWDNRAIIHGFIDRVDKRGEEYKVVDYKTSKKVYSDKELPTSLQFGIYALAVLNKYGALPVESEYRFILIDDAQYALTKGWEKRLATALDKILDSVGASEKKETFIPKPTPLCFWCPYNKQNPDAGIYRMECDYYSLWTPCSKTFDVNKKWDALDMSAPKRRLVF